jgi:hypothetical protein
MQQAHSGFAQNPYLRPLIDSFVHPKWSIEADDA